MLKLKQICEESSGSVKQYDNIQFACAVIIYFADSPLVYLVNTNNIFW